MKSRIILVFVLLLRIAIASCGKKEEAVPEKISTVTGVEDGDCEFPPVEDFYEAVGDGTLENDLCPFSRRWRDISCLSMSGRGTGLIRGNC